MIKKNNASDDQSLLPATIKAASDGANRAPTPLPKGRLFTLFLLTLNESFSENVMWPFMPFMVKDFGYAESEVGVYVGLLASSYFAVQFFSSFAWGKLADVVGRRPTLLGGLAGTIGSIIWFGLSPNYTQALLSRSLSGLVNGNLGITKAYIAEITDSSNRVAGFATLAAAWGVGGVVAPSVGGFLSHPSFLPSSWTIFHDHPYFLPCFFTAIIGAAGIDPYTQMNTRQYISCDSLLDIATILGLFALPETPVFLATKARRRAAIPNDANVSPVVAYGALSDDNTSNHDDDASSNGRLRPSSSYGTPGYDNNGVTTTVVDVQPAVGGVARNSNANVVAAAAARSQSSLGATAATWADGVPGDPFAHTLSPSSWSIISYPDVMITTTCYGITCMIWVFFDETFALFCQTPLADGGLSMNESQIGICLAVCGSIMVLFQVSINAPLNRRFGVVRIYHWCLFLTGPFFIIFPSISSVQTSTSSGAMWVVMVLFMIIRGVINALIYLTIGVCVNNALPSHYSGIVNGFAQSLCALGRAVGPLLGGVIWSWSIQLDGFAARNYVMYAIMAVLTAGNYWWSRRLQPHLDIGFAERHTVVEPLHHHHDGSDDGHDAAHDKEAIDLDQLRRASSSSSSSIPSH